MPHCAPAVRQEEGLHVCSPSRARRCGAILTSRVAHGGDSTRIRDPEETVGFRVACELGDWTETGPQSRTSLGLLTLGWEGGSRAVFTHEVSGGLDILGVVNLSLATCLMNKDQRMLLVLWTHVGVLCFALVAHVRTVPT